MRESGELLAAIGSRSRFSGSESEAQARRICAKHLEQSGLATIEEEFEFSEFPGRYGVSFIGLLVVALILVTLFVDSNHGATSAFIVWAAGSSLVVSTSSWLTRHGSSGILWMTAKSANLVAHRGNPAVWLVAHLDSKSQTIPMLARIASIVIVVSLLIILGGVLLWSVWNGTAHWLITIIGIAAMMAAVPLIICLTGDRSAGAADNASGVVAVLLAARALRARADVGVIVTSSEELGLAGARWYVISNPDTAVALNCDTVDDAGRFLCMVKGGRGAAVQALQRAASKLDMPLAVRSMLPGVLADNVAFTDAGWDAITLSRGNIATLARVHTTSDNLSRLRGTGIAQAARLLAATIEELG